MFKNFFRKNQKPVAPKSYYNLEGIVGKYYEMNPETEDMLDSGVQLENGMIVLPESSLRVDLPDITSEESYYRARRYNRWFKVSNVSGPHATYSNPDATLMHFTATYEDGVKSRHSINQSYSWLVKIDSLPKTLDEMSDELLPYGEDDELEVVEGTAESRWDLTVAAKKTPVSGRRVNCQGEGCVGCSDCKDGGTDYSQQEIYSGPGSRSFRDKRDAEDLRGQEISFKDLTNNDVGILIMMQHTTFSDDASVVFPSGLEVTGTQMMQLLHEFQNH